MNTQNTTVTATSVNRPFALICSYQVPSTDLDPDFIPSVSVVVGHYDSQEQTKHARQAIQNAALISAWCYQSFNDEGANHA